MVKLRHAIPVTAAILLTVLSIHAASAEPPALTNADVVRLVAMHVSERTVIAVIQEAKATAFDLSDRAVGELSGQLVPSAVIGAMRQTRAKPSDTVIAPAAPATRTLADAAAEAAAKRQTSPAAAVPAPPAAPSQAPARNAPQAARPDWDARSDRNMCVASLVGDSHLPEAEAVGACKVRSSKEFYICAFQVTSGGEVDGSTAVNACMKNSSKAFWNCVYQEAKGIPGRDKRAAVDRCLSR